MDETLRTLDDVVRAGKVRYVGFDATIVNIALPDAQRDGLIPVGMLLGAGGMAWLSQLTPTSDYATSVLGAIMLIGLGMGSIVAPSMNTATIGVEPRDAGVASALVNTSQQVGGSVGTAVLSTIVASAAASAGGSPLAAATHGYATAFGVSAGIYLLGALLALALLPRRPATPAHVQEIEAEGAEAGDASAVIEVV